MGNSAAYLVAAIVAILYTLRKLEIQKLGPADFPEVDAERFNAWQRRETASYNLISLSSLLMIVADLAWRWFATRNAPSWRVVQIVGATIFFGWIAATLVGMLRARAARQVGRQLGIQPGRSRTA